jgi:hypothetical protein
MSGTLYVKILPYLHMYSNATSYWTMMANNGHYLYMLSTKHRHIGQKSKKPMATHVYQIQNTVDYHYFERILKELATN